MVILGFLISAVLIFSGQLHLGVPLFFLLCFIQDAGERLHAQGEVEKRHQAIARARIDN